MDTRLTDLANRLVRDRHNWTTWLEFCEFLDCKERLRDGFVLRGAILDEKAPDQILTPSEYILVVPPTFWPFRRVIRLPRH